MLFNQFNDSSILFLCLYLSFPFPYLRLLFSHLKEPRLIFFVFTLVHLLLVIESSSSLCCFVSFLHDLILFKILNITLQHRITPKVRRYLFSSYFQLSWSSWVFLFKHVDTRYFEVLNLIFLLLLDDFVDFCNLFVHIFGLFLNLLDIAVFFLKFLSRVKVFYFYSEINLIF